MRKPKEIILTPKTSELVGVPDILYNLEKETSVLGIKVLHILSGTLTQAMYETILNIPAGERPAIQAFVAKGCILTIEIYRAETLELEYIIKIMEHAEAPVKLKPGTYKAKISLQTGENRECKTELVIFT